MGSVKVQIRFEAEERNGVITICVKTIKLIEGNPHVFPEEDQDQKYHGKLFSLSIIKKGCTNLKKKGQFRNIKLTLSNEIMKLYLDSEENFLFNNKYLDEVEMGNQNREQSSDENYLIQRIKELEKRVLEEKPLNLSEVSHKFLINKFNGKQEAQTWMQSFEKECERFKISKNTTKIEALKVFLEGNSIDWYNANLIKISISDWDAWKNSFLLTYGKINWAPIRTAFNYKYLYGSLIDFVIKKENLLLEADRNMQEIFRTYQIVYSLPLEIQDKLDRRKINNINDLIHELKIFNDSYIFKKKTEEENKEQNKKKYIYNNSSKSETTQRKPCQICEKLGYKNRFHPIEICRNKNKKEVNLSHQELENSDEEDQKNVSTHH